MGKKDIPLAGEGERILAYTAEEANRLDDYWIETDHLVRGILRERNSPATARLEASGLTIEQGQGAKSRLPPRNNMTTDPAGLLVSVEADCDRRAACRCDVCAADGFVAQTRHREKLLV